MIFDTAAPIVLYILALPLLVVCASISLRRTPNIRAFFEIGLAFVCFVLTILLCKQVVEYGVVSGLRIEMFERADLTLQVDLLGALFACMAAGLWMITSVYALGYLRGTSDNSEPRFMSFLAVSLFATFIVAFAQNLLTLYLGYELLSFATYPLVTHYGNAEARHAGRKYLFYIFGSSVAFALPALVILYSMGFDLSFGKSPVLTPNSSKALVVACYFLFLYGFAKAAVFPLHSWLPGAMVAPTPVSALLHAVAVVKVGVFSVIRAMLYFIGPAAVMSVTISGVQLVDIGIVIAAFTMLYAAFVALSQDGLKRRLAFSTISQLAYIVLGTLLFAPKAAAGAMLHIGVHAVSKITLFFCAGSIYVASKEKNISGMRGIARKMPVTMGAFTIGSLSIIGFPLTAGFWSKWNLLQGAINGGYELVAAFYVLGSLLAGFYLFPIIVSAYSEEVSPKLQNVKEADWKLTLPLAVTAALCVILFFGIDPIIELLDKEVESIFYMSEFLR